jgi:nucleotide-binding universal stress UspA family protein
MFSKILVPLDGSSLAEEAIGTAAAIARVSHAEIDVVLVHQPIPFAGIEEASWNAEQWNKEHQYLEGIIDELMSSAKVPATHSVMRGEAVDMICRRAWNVGADLIVMTSHGRTGLSRAWLGSVADSVLRHSTVPVLMLHPLATKEGRLAAHHAFKRILVPVDGSSVAADIISSAASLAHCGGAVIDLLRVVEPVPLATMEIGIPYASPALVPDDEATAHAAEEAGRHVADLARTASQLGITANAHVLVAEHAAPAIVDYAAAHSIDCIAMTTHGRGASRLVMGSVVDKVLRASAVPMLLYRPSNKPIEARLTQRGFATGLAPAT